MMQLILITIVLLAICVALMSVRVIFKKGGRFKSGHACQFERSRHHRRPDISPATNKKTK